jgi:hypothetical protein
LTNPECSHILGDEIGMRQSQLLHREDG